MTEQQKHLGYLYFMADFITLLLEISIYFVSFCGPVMIVVHFRDLHPVLILLLVIMGWLLACLVFIFILISIKYILIGEVQFGRFLLTSPRAYKWIVADRLVKIMIRSPFRSLINENFMLRYFFYRGMGAKINSTFLIGNGVKIPEPWALSVGRNVHVGDEAVLAGHKVEHNTVTLGQIVIGDNVLIGARAIIFPGVMIGDGAMVGANSVVSRGTIIASKEIWSGNPAKKVDLFAAWREAGNRVSH